MFDSGECVWLQCCSVAMVVMELRGDDSHNYSSAQGSTPASKSCQSSPASLQPSNLHREWSRLHEPSGDADSLDLFMFSSAWDEGKLEKFYGNELERLCARVSQENAFYQTFSHQNNSGTTVRSQHLGKLHSDWSRDLLLACDWFRVVQGPRHLCSCHNYVRAWIAYK